MENLIDNLKRELEKESPRIKIRGLSFIDNEGRFVFAAIKATNTLRNPLEIETPIKDVKFGMQLLNVVDSKTYQRSWRVDNSHNSLFSHSHSGSMIFPIKVETFGDALETFLGVVPYEDLLNRINNSAQELIL